MIPNAPWSRLVLAVAMGLFLWPGMASAGEGDRFAAEICPEMRAAIEQDWTLQEKRLGRTPHSPQAIRDAIRRAVSLLDCLGRMPHLPDLSGETAALDRLCAQAETLPTMDQAARLRLYRQVRYVARSAALKNPLLAGKPIAFLARGRFVSQMLHEYLGYYYDYGNIAGGGVYVLEEPGKSLKTRDLIQGRLPRGNYTTLALSYDARTLYFAYCERAPQKPEFDSPQRRCFHLFAVGIDGQGLRQLTDGPDDDFDPCPLPDGAIAFMSTRRGGFGRCHNPWEPLPAYTLHRLEPSGQIRALSLHETNEWHPAVLPDGRIVYSRWDYVDRSAANYHGLWTSRPDGTNPQALFGNYTERINACYQPRPIPGSRRVAFIAGAHHAVVGGSLVVVDPARTQLDRQSGLDRFEAIETLTPEVCFPEAPGWPETYFHSPWPLAEGFYLVAFSLQPLPGMGPNVPSDNPTGLYYFDRFGNLELLYPPPGISAMYPIPLEPRPKPPVIPSVLGEPSGNPRGVAGQPAAGDVGSAERDAPCRKDTGKKEASPATMPRHDVSEAEAELYVVDVRRSLLPLPPERPIVALRIFQILPKTETHVANKPRIGYANAESARMLLGTVPVERDGSAYFRVPARKPIYFQAVDGRGRAVQTMRSVTYLQPNEQRGCIGCHEPPATAPPRQPLLALQRAPSAIVPGPDGTRPMSFVRLVQPVLQRYCLSCHGQQADPKAGLVLTSEPRGEFTTAYENLRPFVRWHEWGGASISQAVTRPGHCGADESPLSRILDDENHGPKIGLTEDARQRILLWLDSNAPFYGVYTQAERLAQLRGQQVPPPQVQ